ncbi:DEAD/DEAH box helicase family protein [Vibrio hangzhouensis]|uniref:Superfamily II DNA or RNA helicase n=1 Tax=Vibrio hangzhouensis TaxID=462991 RepID=A0A1H5Y810_9VIBR|nr:DEAD/DEAH box helicase family protein [Vibrio hangzhouensis]SEG19636.1 Superfamily II DNA or RNA helicase [Vibrio hangzhouensis]
MKFSALNLKTKYDSDEDHILKSFYIPLLARASQYDRAVGYFSSEVLSSVAEGLEKFVEAGGKMRLIIGDPLSDCEYEALMEGKSNPIEAKSEQLCQLLQETKNRKLCLLKYLIATQRLDIKFAFTHRGMFHKKIGVFSQKGEQVVFSGSANETIAGLSKYNSEEISVFFSWRGSFSDYGQVEVDDFEALWNDRKKRTRVVSLTSSAYQKIRNGVDLGKLKKELFPIVDENSDQQPFFEYSFPKSKQTIITVEVDAKTPRKPLTVKGKPFTLFPHQVGAIESWRKSGHQGLFKLATGAGKTFTSISALVELYEERRKIKQPTFAVISVPYVELANQWVQELSPFNIVPVQCYEKFKKWNTALEKKILRFCGGRLDFVCVVVVNKTMSSATFRGKISKIPNEDLVFIGDECHHLGSQGYFDALPLAKYRIGLSATPFRSEEDEVEGSPFPDTVKQNLLSYFQGIVSEYTLNDAINDGILAPYKYDLVPVRLTEDEQARYDEYSEKIQKMIIRAQSSSLSGDERLMLTTWCGARARIIATCEGKIPALINYLKQNPTLSLAHSLFYAGEGTSPDDEVPFITLVTNRLHEFGCKVAKFTSQESSAERRRIMNNFKNRDIDALVAMKVLDEGIDVPVCQSAFILASTRNPRQYVQRRGRVLRRAEGKNEALIVDFVVLPFPGVNNNYSQNLRRAELERIEDFQLTASNSEEVARRIIELGIY